MKWDIWRTWPEVKKICQGKTVVFFGCSEDWVHKTCPKFDYVKNKYFVDSNPAYHGKKLVGLDIKSPEALFEEDKQNLYVVITAGPYESVTQQLLAMGFVDGENFCVTPELRDWGLLREIREYDQDVVVVCSDYEHTEKGKKRKSKLGGGLYLLNTADNKVEKKAAGHYRQVVTVDDSYYCVEFVKREVHQISRKTWEVENIYPLDVSPNQDVEKPNACGIDYHPGKEVFVVVNAGSDTFNVYSKNGFELLEKHHFSETFEKEGTGQHHVNDICIVGDYVFATYFSFTGNWKRGIMDGGVCQLDLGDMAKPAKRLVDELWMPHSVKFLDGKLCYLDSMRGTLCVGNQTVAGRMPGFTRGLTYDGRFYFIGQSEDMYMSRSFGISDNIMCNAGVYLFDAATKVSRFYSMPNMMNVHDLLILDQGY